MKRIDIYTIDIGGGHIAPAQALKQQFDIQGHKDLEVRVVNLGITLGMIFLRYVYKFYWDKALRYPPLINAFYRGADNPFMVKILDRILGITALPKFVHYLETEKPDLIVTTYFTFTHYLELLKQVGQLDATTVVLNPEPFDSHQIWFSKSFDWSMVFSRKSRDEIVAKGLAANKVKVFRFPIKPSFTRRQEPQAALRHRLGLAQKPFTVLFFFGAEGIGPAKKFISALILRGLTLQVVVVCGRNEKLRADMEALSKNRTGHVHIEVRGYATNLADYIAAADVVVGKSGPNQVFETLQQGRPIVISSFLANEKETTKWVIENKVGWLTRTPEHLATLLAKLSTRPALLKEYQANVRKLNVKSGAPEICDFLYGLVKEKRPGKKRPMQEAFQRIRERVTAEGEAFTRRMDEAQDKKRLRKATRTAKKKPSRRGRPAARKTASKKRPGAGRKRPR